MQARRLRSQACRYFDDLFDMFGASPAGTFEENQPWIADIDNA